MVNLGLTTAWAGAFYSAASTAKSVITGNNDQGQGPYSSMLKRAERGVVAGILGASVIYVAPAIAPSFISSALINPATLKTGLAFGTIAINTPSLIAHIVKGDTGADKPYGSFTARLLTTAQGAATGAAIGYLCYENPEITQSIFSTGYEAAKPVVSTILTATFDGLKFTASATLNATNSLAVGIIQKVNVLFSEPDILQETAYNFAYTAGKATCNIIYNMGAAAIEGIKSFYSKPDTLESVFTNTVNSAGSFLRNTMNYVFGNNTSEL